MYVLRAMQQDQHGNYIRANIIFAELDTGGKRVECPRCHVPFNPHLGIYKYSYLSFIVTMFFFATILRLVYLFITTIGNLIAEKFPCENCKGYLCYRNNPARTSKCRCCNISRPLQSMFSKKI